MSSPLGQLPDLAHIPGQFQQWTNTTLGRGNGRIAPRYQKFDEASHPDAKVPFFNALWKAPAGPSFTQGIV